MSYLNPGFSSKIKEIEESKPILPPNSINNSSISDKQNKSKYKKDFMINEYNNKENKSEDYNIQLKKIKSIFLFDNSILSDNKTINDDNYDINIIPKDDINNVKDSNATFNSLKMSNEFGNSLLQSNNILKINETGINTFNKSKNNNMINNRYQNLDLENNSIKEKNSLIKGKNSSFHHKQVNSQLEFSMDMIEQTRNLKISYNKLTSLYNINKKKCLLFNLLIFFNCEDFKILLNLNKHLRILIIRTIIDTYYPIISENLRKSKKQNKIEGVNKNENEIFEILKSKLHFEKVKKGFKIDIITNIRISPKEEYFEPKNISIAYLYKNLISDKNNKKERLVDYYSFDFFPENSLYFPSLYMIREFTSFYFDNLQKTYIQPILPFKTYDQCLLNFNIFSPGNYFIDPNSIKMKIIINPLKDKKNFQGENPRNCEFEDICLHWKNISFLKEEKIIMKQLIEVFTPQFNIIRILYDDVGYLVFKVTLKAVQTGLIYNKEELGIDLLIKEKNDCIINEIKKNDLLFEKRNVFELRVGDIIIFYLKQ